MNIKQLQQKIEQYDNELKNNEIREANLKGKQENILENLKEKFNITDIEEIDLYIENNEQEIEKLEHEINLYLEELEQFEILGE